MAIIRSLSQPMRRGGQGDTTFYVRGRQQVTRQRRNNSNYGESASRSLLQQSARVRWANVINFYKACKSWMPKAFESKRSNQSDYNAFIRLNVASSEVYLTKDQAAQGVGVVAPYQISNGQLRPVTYEHTADGVFLTDIRAAITITGTTTWGEVSQAIITASPIRWHDGDNIAVIGFGNPLVDDDILNCRVEAQYIELTLDISSTALATSMPAVTTSSITSAGYLQFSLDYFDVANPIAMAILQTRRDNGLKVSPASVVLSGQAVYSANSTAARKAAAIASYGLDVEVPLEPGA